MFGWLLKMLFPCDHDWGSEILKYYFCHNDWWDYQICRKCGEKKWRGKAYCEAGDK